MRRYLRSLAVFAGEMPSFDPDAAPTDPQVLFERWLREAADAGVREPHAMTLSTVDADGRPDARVLILKDVADGAWWFAGSAASAKGVQLAGRPVAALTFYWPEVGRQIRLRGPVTEGTPEQSAEDFLDRGPRARAVSTVSRESQPLDARPTCVAAIADAERRRSAASDEVPTSWRAYAVKATAAEFWQADRDRMHIRLRYEWADGAWERGLLWP